jgi:hypothetical protein
VSFIIRVIVNALALWLAAYLVSGIVVDTTAHTGDIGSASGLVQLQAAFAALRAAGATGPDDCALVTGTDREGAVHVALVRLPQDGAPGADAS